MTVTVPVARDYRVREFRAGDQSCVDTRTRAGKCASTRDRFNAWATMNAPFPARVVIRGGTIVEVDELDLPG
jgi:hypothetical protein